MAKKNFGLWMGLLISALSSASSYAGGGGDPYFAQLLQAVGTPVSERTPAMKKILADFGKGGKEIHNLSIFSGPFPLRSDPLTIEIERALGKSRFKRELARQSNLLTKPWLNTQATRPGWRIPMSPEAPKAKSFGVRNGM